MRKIVISDKNHFNDALKFSKKLGKKSKNTFLRSIRTINRLKRNRYPDYVLDIRPDFVSHSFVWAFYKLTKDNQIEKSGMNGGMILHGFEETFSVELSPENFPHWSIHT